MLDVKPLSARSVVLSLVLGAHPRGMTPRELGVAGEHVGVPGSTVRVALTRAVANDELRRDGTLYVLGPRLLARQARQDAHAREVPWDGTWETAVVVVSGRSAADRAALRETLADARLAELREGVWMRPANLRRSPGYSARPVLRTMRATPDGDPAELAATLWDLAGWADEATATMALLRSTERPAERLAVAAHLVRHLSTDPLLPAALQPARWPAEEARRAYAAYQRELQDLGHSETVSSR